jgi:hypothetical protein
LAEIGELLAPALNGLEAAGRPGVQLYYEPVRVR